MQGSAGEQHFGIGGPWGVAGGLRLDPCAPLTTLQRQRPRNADCPPPLPQVRTRAVPPPAAFFT